MIEIYAAIIAGTMGLFGAGGLALAKGSRDTQAAIIRLEDGVKHMSVELETVHKELTAFRAEMREMDRRLLVVEAKLGD